MPVVMGHAIDALCCCASLARSSLMVRSFPAGTFFMRASTSFGAGMTIVPVPQRLVILPVILATLGSPLLSASFSRHDFPVFIITYFDPKRPKYPCSWKRGARPSQSFCSASRRTVGAVDSIHDLTRQSERCRPVGGTPTGAVET